MSRAPDNMPTETIQRFIDTQEQGFAQATRDEETAMASLNRAVHQKLKTDARLSEYKGWLWDRENGR